MAASTATKSDDTGVDAKIVHPLEQLRSGIRQYVLSDGLLTAGLFVILWFWLGMALDYGVFRATAFDWVLDAPKALRAVALIALGVLLLGILVTRLAFRLTKSFSYPALALVLEKRYPEILGDRLITAVELADVGKMKSFGYSETMIRQTIDEARERVALVPVSSVFNWYRLKWKAVLLVGFALGILLAAFVGFSIVTRQVSVKRFSAEFGDVAAIWGERNLLLRNTPWPRKAHLEFVGFPNSEMRIGKDAASPKVRTRAYKWVMVDRTAVHGWRPLGWSDLNAKMLGFAPVAITPTIAGNDGKPLPPDAAGWDADRIEALAGNAEGVRTVFEKLELLVANPKYSRTLRKLDIPEAVSLSYNGIKTGGRVNLNREANNEFVGEISGLKESIRFAVRAADFASMPKVVTLVPPPMFAKLTRTELQPAYLYHAPPIREASADPKAPRQNFADLKGLRQLTGDKDLSLTGDKSVFSIIQGTEFELKGQSDKALKKVLVRPKIGKIPGLAAVSVEALELKPEGESRDRFSIAFRDADRPLQTIEFEIVLVDDDGVTSMRSILVTVTEDQPPQVELAVDVLRKQGNTYLVTPVARIPFVTESKVKDDAGLSQVVFAYNYAQQDAQVVTEVKANALAGIWAGAPLSPTIAAALVPLTSATFTMAMFADNSGQRTSGSFPVTRFQEDFAKLNANTKESLLQQLAKPADPDKSQVVREVRFPNQELDAFDLKVAIPGLLERDANKLQSRYKLELNLLATDANYEMGPKTGQSLEPIRLLVISEAELLAEMSKDEETQASKLDDVLKKLRDAQTKLNQTSERLLSPNPAAEVITNAAVRSQDVAQDIGKAHDMTNGILTEFRRLEREATFNDIREETLKGYRSKIADLTTIAEKLFPQSEASHAQVQTVLVEGRRPEEPLLEADKRDLAEVIRAVSDIREKLGEAISLSNIRSALDKLRKNQLAVGASLSSFRREILDRLYLPEIAAIPLVELAQGEKKKLSHAINWKAYTGGALVVKCEGPKSGELTFPKEIPLPEDKDSVDYELAAGTKPGEYTIRLIPSAGTPVEVKIRVK